MKKHFIFIFTLFMILGFSWELVGQTVSQSNSPIIDENRIVIKIRPTSERIASSDTEDKQLSISSLNAHSAVNTVRQLDYNKSQKQGKVTLSAKESVLDNIFIIELGAGENVNDIITEFSGYSNVVYVEPMYQEQLLFTPNDQNIESQPGLELINAYDAWDVTQGSESIIIGVSDTGVQLDHVDLAGNLFFNEADPINGLDDDGNGFVDDYQGWDFADSDNNPSADQSGHGTQVAGVSSAVTNNGTGMAGVGFNSKFVPLKVFRSSNGFSFNTYESIIYAADQGYDVINLSWGSAGTYSQFSQDVINYAVLEKDLVVVAAAGNTNAELVFYPASYDHVLSVANTDMSDNKSPGATFSYNVDLTAPGFGIHSTVNGNGYANTSGSSFSSPHVAGAAALVKSVFPNLSAQQIMQQVRVTADDIYSIGDNSDYRGQLGKGRLNIHRAVSDGNTRSLRIEDFSYGNSFGEYAFFDDTVKISFQLMNFLKPTVSATASISSENPHITVLGTDVAVGAVGEMEVSGTLETTLMVSDEAQHNERVVLRLDFSDENYQDFDHLEFNLSPSDLNIDNSVVALNISNNGNLGYPVLNSTDGIGFEYQGIQLAQNLGIMVGNHPDSISDNVVTFINSYLREQDFQELDKIKFRHFSKADWYARSSFDDSDAGLSSLGLIIEQEALAWNDTGNNEYIIIEYRVSNNADKVKENLRVGFYANWNIGDKDSNIANWDADSKLAFTKDFSESGFVGMALLSGQSVLAHSIDVGEENGNVAEITTAFTDEDKYDLLNSEKISAGVIGVGNDVAQLLSAEIGSIEPSESEKIVFVLSAASSLSELQANVSKASERYAEFINTPPVVETHEVCKDLPFNLNLESGNQFELFDDVNMTNLIATGNDFEFPGIGNDTIVFVRNIDSSIKSDVQSVAINLDNPVSDFKMEPDTLYLGDSPISNVKFTDFSETSVSWLWSFGNGSFSSIQSPTEVFNEKGTYQVTLQHTAADGCTGLVVKELVVAERSDAPVISNPSICKGESVQLVASNSSNLKVYANLDDLSPIFEGNTFNSGILFSDTTFFVSSLENVFESNRVEVLVDVNDLEIDFLVQADTLDVNSKNQINLIDNSSGTTSFEWYVDNVLVGDESTVGFVFDNQETLSIRLVATNALGCVDSITKSIQITQAEIPLIDNIQACQYDQIVLAPNNGHIFYFYEEPSLSQAVFKGRSLLTEKLQADKTYYITNADGLKESLSKEVLISIYPSEIEIQTDPKVLILSEERNVSFSFSSDQEIVSSIWYINGAQPEASTAPVLNFNLPGEYKIDLLTENTNGCIDTTSLTYEVLNVPITGIEDNISNQIIVYPNPTTGLLKIKTPGTIQNLQILNPAGRVIEGVSTNQKASDLLIDLRLLPNGVYFLKGLIKDEAFIKTILIQK